MTAKRTRESNTKRTGSDLISELPDNIIDDILQRMPLRDATRTSLLSKRWRYRWSLMQELNFGKEFYKTIKHAADRRDQSSTSLKYQFERIVNRVFLLHDSPIVGVTIYLPDFQPDEISDVNRWILYLMRKGVNKLALDNRQLNPHKLPSYFFSCRSFTHLNLRNFAFAPPPDFKGFCKITHLEFVWVDFMTNIFETIIPNAPLLKELKLCGCSGLDYFKVNAPNLENLWIEANGEFKAIYFQNVPNLTCVSVELDEIVRNSNFHKAYTLASYLDSLPKVEKHSYNGKFLQYLATIHFPMKFPTMVDSLKALHLREMDFTNFDEVSCVLYLLKYFPNIEELDIRVSCAKGDESVPGYLELQESKDYPLAKLRTVKMKHVEGLRSELLFVKLLLSNAVSLQKMIIIPDRRLPAESLLSMTEDLISFHRASPFANVKYIPHC